MNKPVSECAACFCSCMPQRKRTPRRVKAKSGVSSPAGATKEDEGDLYFVSPEGEFIASYGPDAAPKDIGTEWDR